MKRRGERGILTFAAATAFISISLFAAPILFIAYTSYFSKGDPIPI